MQIVIDIPEETYKGIMLGKWYKNGLAYYVQVGTPLPKGHGRLGDLDKVADDLKASRDDYDYYEDEYERGMYSGYDYSLDEVMNAPTIIEADKE